VLHYASGLPPYCGRGFCRRLLFVSLIRHVYTEASPNSLILFVYARALGLVTFQHRSPLHRVLSPFLSFLFPLASVEIVVGPPSESTLLRARILQQPSSSQQKARIWPNADAPGGAYLRPRPRSTSNEVLRGWLPLHRIVADQHVVGVPSRLSAIYGEDIDSARSRIRCRYAVSPWNRCTWTNETNVIGRRRLLRTSYDFRPYRLFFRSAFHRWQRQTLLQGRVTPDS